MTDTTHGAATASDDLSADIAALMNMIGGGAIAQVLHAIAALHIADHLADGPLTAEEVAATEGSHPGATYRLMRAAASLGLLSHEGGHSFALTRRGTMLRTGVPGSLRSLTLALTGHAHWKSWELFPDAVREGASQAKKALGADIFAYYARPENLQEAALFSEAMADLSGLVVQTAVAAIDTTDVSTVVDVGGADGQFVLALLAQAPGLLGQVLDLPHATARAVAEAERLGLSDRFSAVAGDFFVEVPGADLYLLKTVLHDWDDSQCETILRNCRSATHVGGRALVVETVVGEIGRPDFATLSDMSMLAMTNGMERELGEFDSLFTASGWRRGRTRPVGGGYVGMELAAI
jgi:hypothetical protein